MANVINQWSNKLIPSKPVRKAPVNRGGKIKGWRVILNERRAIGDTPTNVWFGKNKVVAIYDFYWQKPNIWVVAIHNKETYQNLHLGKIISKNEFNIKSEATKYAM